MLSGAPLDEVWRDSDMRKTAETKKVKKSRTKQDPPKRKKKVRKNKGPLCDLYTQGYSSSFDDIMDAYQSSHFDMKNNIDDDGADDDGGGGGVRGRGGGGGDTDDEEDEEEKEGEEEEEEEEVEEEYAKRLLSDKAPNHNTTHNPRPQYQLQELNIKSTSVWPEFALYIVSGILFIFILESFVHLGASLQQDTFI